MRENVQVELLKKTGNLYCSTGRKNDYVKAFLDGLGASSKEWTWSKKKHIHTCCGSKVCWKHKVNCKLARKEPKGNKKWQELKNADKQKMLQDYFG